MALFWEEELSFASCIRNMAPDIRNRYVGDGTVIMEWSNARSYKEYESVFPEALRNLTGQIAAGKNDRILFVSDSPNMIRKAACYYAMQKHRSLHLDYEESNRPLRGEQMEEIPTVLLAVLDLRTEKEELLRLWKGMDNLDEWHCVYVQNFDAECKAGSSEKREYVWEALFEERDCNVLLGVSNSQYGSAGTARLICEGGFRPVFLPKEPEDYYVDFAQNLFVQPAMKEYICMHPGEFDFCSDRIFDEIGYLSFMGIGEIQNVLAILQRRRGDAFTERDIAVLFDQTRDAGCNLLDFLHGQRPRTYRDLQEMSGFEQIKNLVKRKRALFKGSQRNPNLEIREQHYLFVGNPGTGKTEGARLMHEVLSGEGFLTGNLVIATRQDIVASYTGQTAPKVARLFDRAAGGTLFVDEAGFFLQQQCGGFIHEAIKEFVRYMELRRDVTVIFAVYPGERERFLKLDPGLASRIGQTVLFRDHDEALLCEIGASMWQKQGYELEPEAWDVLKSFLRTQKEKNRESFGNGREVRRLVELSIQETEIRLMEEDCETDGSAGNTVVKLCDLRRATETVMDMGGRETRTMGFGLTAEDKRERGARFAAACQAC